MGLESLTVDQKFAKVVIDLRKVRPFYSAIYEAMPHIETDRIETMGVTTNKLYYNPKFVEGKKYKEFLFVVLHEIAHMALLHPLRGEKLDKELFNIACDLYVNKLVADEFGVEPGTASYNANVQMPTDGLYCSSIDLDVDYAEGIYEQLYNQAKENGYFDNQKSDSDNFEFNIHGSTPTNSKYDDLKITINRQYVCDLIPGKGDRLQQEDEARQILAEAKTRFEMFNDGSGAGNEAGRLKFMVDEILKSHLDWKKLLRKFCIKHRSTDSSFARPDKRMYYQQAIYPGQVENSEEVLKNVKICMDTSGSVSDTDTKYIMGQIDDILKAFKTEAELICWDTEVECAYDFNRTATIKQKGLSGRGGTDPTCVFEYFESKQCKVKPFVTLIFTDGYFYGDEYNNPKFKRKYKNTIWVMTKNYNKQFEPPFGKLAVARFDD